MLGGGVKNEALVRSIKIFIESGHKWMALKKRFLKRMVRGQKSVFSLVPIFETKMDQGHILGLVTRTVLDFVPFLL